MLIGLCSISILVLSVREQMKNRVKCALTWILHPFSMQTPVIDLCANKRTYANQMRAVDVPPVCMHAWVSE